ncbi:PucR family transcriptional regulator [Nocardioides zeae]|uniref:PucR C-terminal helix-turn-helix domain-containing protein n=1 Tax=Nocardioides zeae TaxID=1457234 RepID=A0AAJ1U6U8_9ACTN|nr:PucR family transcriptional regulator [Nocardioides zeae]MDQ1106683.1 hypothetical protein [Nocardioides zeae]
MTSARSAATLRRVLDDLGPALLEVVHGHALDGVVSGVAFHDPIDDSYVPPRAVVLAIGMDDPDEIAATVERLGRREAAALIVRSPVAATPALESAVATSGVPVVGLTRGASWAQLAAMIRASLFEDVVADDGSETLGGVASGDLFALANAMTAMIDAPVTIEDRSSRVLAYSGRQDEGDSARVETVLGRQVPDRFTKALLANGVLHDLYRSSEPVWVDPEPPEPDTLPRVAMAVRVGDEILGSIWAVVREPLTDHRKQALVDASKLVALHMLRLRAGAHGSQQLRADLVTTAVGGGPAAHDALRRLGLSDQRVLVLALGLIDDPVESVDLHARRAADRERISSALAMQLTAVHPRCASALIGEVCYGLVPAGSQSAEAAERAAVRVATEFLSRTTGGEHAVIGIGQVSARPADVVEGRRSADRVLRVLTDQRGRHRRVARLEDVHVESLLLELRDLVVSRGDRPTGPVARLVEHDSRRGSRLTETLQAWLDHFGDVAAAATSLYLHPNTFRYRLRKVVEVSGLDLEDPEARLAAMLQLRVVLGATPQEGGVSGDTGP